MIRGEPVTVVVPARNGLPDVLDAVQSALDQRLAPEGIRIVDDASTDGTGAAVRARFGERVTVLDGRFGSAAAARNAGWRAAPPGWIALLDADDLWLPDKLAVARDRLERTPAADWFFSDGAFRTLDGQVHPSWFELYADLPDDYVGQPVGELCDVNFVLTSSVVVHRAALEALGGFDERLSHAEDLDLWIRLARRGPGVAVRRPLVRYQHRPGGLTRQAEARLEGDVALFGRLAADGTLPAPLRRRARRRATLAQYKRAVTALRAGRRAEARRELARVWPARPGPVIAAWMASLLPGALFERLRASAWTKRRVAGPMLQMRRVVLDGGRDPARRGTA